MLRETLLCPYVEHIRTQAVQQLEFIFLPRGAHAQQQLQDAAGPASAVGPGAEPAGFDGGSGSSGGSARSGASAYQWLLEQLVLLRPLLGQRLNCCMEYHHLLCKVRPCRPRGVVQEERAGREGEGTRRW